MNTVVPHAVGDIRFEHVGMPIGVEPITLRVRHSEVDDRVVVLGPTGRFGNAIVDIAPSHGATDTKAPR